LFKGHIYLDAATGALLRAEGTPEIAIVIHQENSVRS
jgi:hypothetical protein